MQKPKKVLTSKVVHKNPFYQIRKDEYLKKSNKKSTYYTVTVDPFVIICAVDRRKGIYLVKNWRYPLKRYAWELPAGKVDRNETPLMAAKRELKEETGISAKKWKSLGWFHISPGNSNQKGYIYLAESLDIDKKAVIDDEIVEVKRYSIRKFTEMLKKRTLLGAPTLVASQRLFEYLKK